VAREIIIGECLMDLREDSGGVRVSIGEEVSVG